MTATRYTGKSDSLHITFNGKIITQGWSSFQFDESRFLFRLYCHDVDCVPELALNSKGELVVHRISEKVTITEHFIIKVTKAAKPYTFDDAVVYEFSGKVL